MLQADLGAEAASEGFYDAALASLFVLNVPVAFACTVAAKLRHARRLLARRPKRPTPAEAQRHALALHSAGDALTTASSAQHL